MRRTRIGLLAAGILFTSSLGGVALAEEGFFQRWNPMRLFRDAPTRTLSAPTPSQQRLETLRAKLESRGLSHQKIESRLPQRAESIQSADRLTHQSSPRSDRTESPIVLSELQRQAQETRTQIEHLLNREQPDTGPLITNEIIHYDEMLRADRPDGPTLDGNRVGRSR